MKKLLSDLQTFLEKIDKRRDQALFVFIKKFWPRAILPNHITFIRIAIGIALCVFLFFLKIEDKALIIWLFFIGAFTDMLDGSVARCLKKETKLGATLDSIADRILIIPIALYSLFSQHKWLLLFLLLSELANFLVSAYYQSKKIFLNSNVYGKTKMVIQSIVFAVILITWPEAPSVLFIYALWISGAFTLLSIFSKTLEVNKK